MSKMFAFALLLAGSSLLASAKVSVGPEIDPSGAVNAAILISGAVLVIRGRLKK